MFNWHSYDLFATTSGTYLKGSAHFNNPSILFVTFTFYTHLISFLNKNVNKIFNFL